MDKQVALITGVAGFIGSHLAERLVKEGYFIIGVDCFTDFYPRWMKELNLEELKGQEFEFIEADLLELDLVSLLKDRNVRYIYHLAAQAGVRPSWGMNFEVYLRNNILATQKILEAVREVSVEKLVYASSSSVYGDVDLFPISEDTMPRPISPYGVTKLAGEHLCMLYHYNYGIPVVSLRYFTVYGPRQRPDMAFHRFIRAIVEENEVRIFGDGEQTRDFTYVDDVVEATFRAGVMSLDGKVFNIGGGSRVTVNYVIEILEEILGRKALRRYEDAKPGDMRHTAADITLAEKMLGYRPRVSLREGLEKQVRWMVEVINIP